MYMYTKTTNLNVGRSIVRKQTSSQFIFSFETFFDKDNTEQCLILRCICGGCEHHLVLHQSVFVYVLFIEVISITMYLSLALKYKVIQLMLKGVLSAVAFISSDKQIH